MQYKYPWSKPSFNGNEEIYLMEAFRSGWISGGPFIDKFEAQMGSLLGNNRCLAVANGTAAIQLAYMVANLQPDDEILLPAFGFMAAANVALNMRLQVNFYDVDKDSWCPNYYEVSQRISSHTKAIVVINNYGNLGEIIQIRSICEERGILLIEDFAESLGSEVSGKISGTLGHISVSSFHATKTITTGEGGLVVINSDDSNLFDRCQLIRSHGLRRIKHYWHELPGMNFRMTNLQAAIGCAQLENYNEIITARRTIFSRYVNNFQQKPFLKTQFIHQDINPTMWAFGFRLMSEYTKKDVRQIRDCIINQCKGLGIELRPGFYDPSQVVYLKRPYCANANMLSSSVLLLPFYGSLKNDEIDEISNEVLKVTEETL